MQVHVTPPVRETPVHIAIPTAKLHVLHLEPIKARVGDKWPRLSELVHALFEKALRRVQGPHDRFVQVDELSYIATFQGRTPEEAAIACTAVAQDVCDLLFGEDAKEVSLRSVVGLVPEADLEPVVRSDAVLERLEKHGSARVITRHNPADSGGGREAQMQGLEGVHRDLSRHQLSARLFAVWDMARQTSSCLTLQPVGGRTGKAASTVRRLMPHAGEELVADLEIALLSGAVDYARRLHAQKKLCAIATGIGWQTLSVAVTRSRYLAALKSVADGSYCPLMLVLEDVPAGMPAARLGELVTMLTSNHVRVLVQFAPGLQIPDPPFRLHAAGIGSTLSEGCNAEMARAIIDKLNRRAEKQHAFSFLGGIPESLVAMAKKRSLRFGAGPGLDGAHHYTGLETIPDFPLRPDTVHYL